MSSNESVVKTTFNINSIKENIIKINELIKNMKDNGNSNIFEHELEILKTYPEFYQSYTYLVKKICKGGDLSMLDTMFSNLEKVESGESSLASVELNLGNKLAAQYLEPVI